MSLLYNVKNRGASTVVYRIPEDGIRRSFAPGEVKKVSSEELEKLTYQPGGLTILTQFLQIQNADVLQQLNIKTEPEYNMSEADVIELLKNGNIDSFLDALDFAPRSIIDLIKKLSIDLPLTDMAKRKALKAKTGFDVEAALKHIEEDKEENGQTTILKQPGERRVKAEEAPAGRRTTPKYNIINKPAEVVSDEKTAE